MTVQQLLEAILKRYPGASADALGSFKSVFYSRFERREGPHLQAAFDECCAVFRATGARPFPIPADIEIHMPSLKRSDKDEGGPPIRDKLQRRQTRARDLLADWVVGQGAKIKDGRSPQLYAACWLEAFDQAKAKALDERVQRLLLDQPTLNRCFQRAISTERVRRKGRQSADPQQAWIELEEIAREWGLTITPDWWGKDMAKSLNRREAA